MGEDEEGGWRGGAELKRRGRSRGNGWIEEGVNPYCPAGFSWAGILFYAATERRITNGHNEWPVSALSC